MAADVLLRYSSPAWPSYSQSPSHQKRPLSRTAWPQVVLAVCMPLEVQMHCEGSGRQSRSLTALEGYQSSTVVWWKLLEV